MKVAFITPEVIPLSKTGGLADVSLALPEALADLGVECTVFTPLYRQAAEWLRAHPVETTPCPSAGTIAAGTGRWPLRCIVVDRPKNRFVLVDNPELFDRAHPYLGADGQDHPDNLVRFSFFCRAVLEYCLQTGYQPQVMHSNDWQTALAPVYLAKLYQSGRLGTIPSLFTIHNIGYQGIFPHEQLADTGLDWDVFTPDQLEFYGKLNLLKGGIVFSQAVNTVSPTYAKQIQTPEFGNGLDGLLAFHHRKVSGILNGIDVEAWNPAVDPHLPAAYTDKNLTGKKTCRRVLQHQMGLVLRPDCLLLGVISRFDRQKGIELLIEAFPQVARLDLQLVVLGSGDRQLEEQLLDLALRYPEQIAVRLGYDEPLAHRIIAGCDAFVMPSRYEPCGLTQMYAQRYGTVPIVRETGGLHDTVTNYTLRRIGNGTASGFTFRGDDPRKLVDALEQAARLFFTDRKTWLALIRQIMLIDHAWPTSAKAYLALYRRLLKPGRKVAGGDHA